MHFLDVEIDAGFDSYLFQQSGIELDLGFPCVLVEHDQRTGGPSSTSRRTFRCFEVGYNTIDPVGVPLEDLRIDLR